MNHRVFLDTEESGVFDHQYDIVQNKVEDQWETCLIRRGLDWSDHMVNKECLKLVDTGNGYKIVPKIPKEMDYNTAAELHILLSFVHGIDMGFRGYIENYEVVNKIIL